MYLYRFWSRIPAAALLPVLVVGPAFGTESVDPTAPPTEPTAQPAVPPGADLAAANELVRDGDYAGAEQLLAALQVEFPDDPRLLLLRGELLLALNKPQQALPLLERTAALDPERPRAHFQLATARQATGDREGALEACARESELNEDPEIRAMAHLNRAVLLEQARRWEDAAGALESVLQIDPDRLEVYGDIATFHLQAGALDEAALCLERGLARGFRSAEHHHVLAARYLENDAFEAAAREFRQALAIEPDLAAAERGLAGALERLGRSGEALEHLRRYLELEPEAPDAAEARERIRALERG